MGHIAYLSNPRMWLYLTWKGGGGEGETFINSDLHFVRKLTSKFELF
jgi:hypothetical protein